MNRILLVVLLLSTMVLPTRAMSAGMADYLILQDIGSYELSIPEFAVLGFPPFGGPRVINGGVVVDGAGHFDEDHTDTTYEVKYYGRTDGMVMAFESQRSFSPSIQKGNGAVGLIQFTKDGAKAIKTPKATLKQMNALQQLDYVEKYLRVQAPKNKDGSLRIRNLGDLYMVVHWPAGAGKGDSYVLYSEDDPENDYYSANKGLDLDGDGKVTRAEAITRPKELLEEGCRYAE